MEITDSVFYKTQRKMDERISASENLILKELDRVQAHLEKEVDEVQINLDEMKQFYRINKE